LINIKDIYGEEYKKISVLGESIFVKYIEKDVEKLLGKIFKDLQLKKNFSSDYVLNFIKELVSIISEKGIHNVKVDPSIVDIFDDNFFEVKVIIPLAGINMVKDLLTVGKINLRKFTDKDFKFHIENVEEIWRINPFHTQQEKDYFITEDRKWFSNFINKTCAEFKIFAEYEIAVDLAINECDKALNLIRYAVSYLHHKDYRMFVGLQGEIQRGFRSIFAFKTDFKKYHTNDKMVGALYPFEITDENITKMRKIGFFDISILLKKMNHELTEFERTLLLGINWFSDSQIQTELQNEFLSLMICMEIFLNPDHKESISSFIPEATPILFVKHEHRKVIKENLVKYYKIRSEIVHGNEINLDSNSVAELRSIVRRLILWMIQNKEYITSKDELVKSIIEQMNDQKLNTNFDLK
jgi:hypothetical protein